MTVKDEEAVVQAFIKMYKDVTKTGDKLNASMLDQLQKMMKSATTMISNTKNIKANTTMSNKQLKFDEKELVVREKLKKADEYLINLRHKLNIEQEREHGDQVRRNINLRHNMDSFNDKFEMLKKSITGGFGFQAAGNTFVKRMGGMTRSFQELEFANQSLADATKQKELKQATVNQLKNHPDEVERKKAEDALRIAEKAEERAKLGVKAAIPPAQGTQGKTTKPIFAQLGKLGEFLGKKAVPIGIGVGVAGVLMSVIVKAFSASPLFAQMMKMMKFMVTLILMPIGTFFGALLRPILILLLRKFIVPFYSTYMPQWMKLGTDIGNFIASWSIDKLEKSRNDGKLTWEDFALTINDLFFKNSGTDDSDDNLDDTNDKLDDIKEETERTNSLLGTSLSIGTGTGTGDEDSDVSIQSNADFIAQVAEHHGLGEAQFIGETPSDLNIQPNEHTWGRGDELPEYVNPIDAPSSSDESNLPDWYKQTIKDAINQHTLGDQEDIFQESRNVGGIIADVVPKVMTQQMTDFAAYGMDKEERGGDIHDAGISMTQEEIDERNAGYQGYGGLSSTVLEGSGGRSSQSVMDNYNAYLAGVVPAADGFNGMVNSPTMFLAGEAGSEHVSITPSGGSGGSGGITINIQNMNGSDNDLRKLKQTILEVIQESSANRGRI